ncbi:uncharacterized protein EI97DRAFT_442432 [Westerdykella ornata]|uniref:Uncharacterized protein n=1 Tax=Westerdykella ornata TaxID=318751 RepID=A0A6A6JJQ5_WESOR|nr:uncharacterized protein EI97DRAFT_442432 [Westerdykella ornata]KAF2276494.1 hypothetical protein EI97DRAFT_442432 [Westerdykella ornata]
MAATTETAAPEAVAATPKFSRYRSVRRGQQEQTQHHSQTQRKETQDNPHSIPIPPVPAIPQMPSSEFQRDAPVSRSMSRYHRRPTVSHGSAQKPQMAPLAAAAPVSAAPSNARSRAQGSAQYTASNSRVNEPAPLPNTSRPRREESPLVSAPVGREPSQAARDEAKQLMEQEAERQRRMQEKLKAQKRAMLEIQEREAEAAQREHRMKDEQELQRQVQQAESAARFKKEEEEEVHRARLRKKAPEAQQTRSPPTSPQRHGLHLFGRRRKEDTPSSPETQTQIEQQRLRSDSSDREFNTIRPGGGGAVPGIDAPVSAINAEDDRRVLVVRNKQEILLPVTVDTTALDLIKSAANCLTEPINVRTATLLENYQKVGVTRPLRNYESVRDVLNSWDDNRSNFFKIVDAPFEGIDQDELLVLGVPAKKASLRCWMYYSSKPGKWSKRFVTLSEEGQLSMAKNMDGKDSQNICHLTDFDIYSPTERKLSKVKPPKKICYAVKSQQRSNIYMDETRFVHFFCSNDRDVASEFYKKIQGWRSWYLVHVLGEGRKERKPVAEESKPTSRNVSGDSQRALGPTHARNPSVSSHYQLGSFLPLLDLDQFSTDRKDGDGYQPAPVPEAPAAPHARLDSKTMHARKMSMRTKGPPPLSYHLGTFGQDSAAPHHPPKEEHTSRSNTFSETESDTFAPEGLLGRKYSERRRALQESEAKKAADPFTEGPSLINNSQTWTSPSAGNENGLARQSSVRSHHRRTSSDMQRSMSTRNRPKPLVDLAPQYKEPPQHARKGKGFHPEGNAGPLVENATSPEEAIKLPPSTTFRAPAPARPAYERTKSLKGRGEGLAAYTVNKHSGAPEDDSIAFTGGLLARTGFSQGRTAVGHGVMDGSKAQGPMLDLREPSKFVSGSLLASVERQHGGPGPANKRHSVDLG